jgi:hypothetical protein
MCYSRHFVFLTYDTIWPTGVNCNSRRNLFYYGPTTLCWTSAAFFSFLNLHTVRRTPRTGDQPVTRPLPTHRTTQTQNKRTQIQTSMPSVGFEHTIPVLQRAKTVHVLQRAATVIGSRWNQAIKIPRFHLRKPSLIRCSIRNQIRDIRTNWKNSLTSLSLMSWGPPDYSSPDNSSVEACEEFRGQWGFYMHLINCN